MSNDILATFIAAYNEMNEITAPPERVLEVLVIAGVATLRFLPGEPGAARFAHDSPPPSIDVPARSLFLALKAQIEEEDAEDPIR